MAGLFASRAHLLQPVGLTLSNSLRGGLVSVEGGDQVVRSPVGAHIFCTCFWRFLINTSRSIVQRRNPPAWLSCIVFAMIDQL